MNAENFDVGALLNMAHSHIHNYIIPGMTSSLIGAPSANGTLRLFQIEREHQENVTPHSHRFDFQCWVLRGSVRNRVWYNTYDADYAADEYQTTMLRYAGKPGLYAKVEGGVERWKYVDQHFSEGQCYGMKAEQVHSIYFSRHTTVLFFEGPTKSDSSIILEPFVNGAVIPTFEVKPWMFK